MRYFAKLAFLGFAIVALLAPQPLPAQKATKTKEHKKSEEKVVWNFDGGAFFETDGSVTEQTCFRIAGRITAPDFFDNLKRIDTDEGAIFRRNKEIITEFPDVLSVYFTIYDIPCPEQMKTIGDRVYLTREMMSTLRLSFFWKHGIDMRPINNFKNATVQIEPVIPYATDVAAELPKRFRWHYEVTVPGEGVPIGDSLVLILRTPDRRIAARVAARL